MLFINVHHEIIVKKILYKFGMFVSTPYGGEKYVNSRR